MSRRLTAKDLKHVYWLAVTDMRYGYGIRIYENYANRRKLTAKQLCQLGLLYDHRALRRRGKSQRAADEKRAMTLYNQALGVNPKFVDALSGIARIYWHRGDRQAIRYYKKLVPLYPAVKRWIAYQNLANAYYTLNRYAQSELWYLKALHSKGRGKGHGLYYNLAKLYYSMKRPAQVHYYVLIALKQLDQFWKKRQRRREYVLTRKLLLKMKDGTL